ncbi:hypothetical protein [Streptomyces sp. NPDC060194]|uniref:hypothetical protein n=1 Tax=Streptomyces sp. NPDC060194 TaxID=3347069 RepID=UPI003656DDF1
MSLLLTTALAAVSLTGCALLDLAEDCDGTEERVAELTGLDIFEAEPLGAEAADGFEKVDADCWADSGDVVAYAKRTYTFPGTRDEVQEHYRAEAERDGWRWFPEEQCFGKDGMSLRVLVVAAPHFEAESLGEPTGLGAGPGTDYWVEVESYGAGGKDAVC